MDATAIGVLAAETMEQLAESYGDDARVVAVAIIVQVNDDDRVRMYDLIWQTKSIAALCRILRAAKRLAEKVEDE